MNELDLARAIRDGTAPSPSRCGNAWLHDIRISGSGLAERPALGETAYRPPEIWTSDDMIQRAAGLPVIFGHPEQKTLNGEEFAKRVVGSVVLPYARGGELRGIARVFDDEASDAMGSGAFSTSPSAVVGGTHIAGSEGVLLIEKDPALLDHIAIVPNNGDAGGGVWDKGGPGTGIRNDSTTEKEPTMTEATEEKPADETGDKLNKIIEGMGGLTDMCKSLATRMDALEGGMKNRPDAVETPAGGGDIHEPATERLEAAELADAQCKADSVASAHGQRAPRPQLGERLRAYRERVLREFQRHSREFAKSDLKTIPAGDVFDTVERQIFADAMEAANNPIVPAGRLIERTRQVGAHTITEFFGKPADCFAPFKSVTHRARFKQPHELRGL